MKAVEMSVEKRDEGSWRVGDESSWRVEFNCWKTQLLEMKAVKSENVIVKKCKEFNIAEE